MEGDAFDVLDAAQELVEGDVALLVAGNLRADAIVGDGAIDDVVVMERPSVRLCAMAVDEVRPLLGIGLKALVAELLKECLFELIDVDHGLSFLELGTELGHFQRLLTVIGKVEGATEVLVGLRQGEVDFGNVDGGAVIESHSVPPFF